MSRTKLFPTGRHPIAVSSGLVALDYVFSGAKKGHYWAGGSCGNVSAILAYLGWHTYPVARLDETPHGQALVNDLHRAGVHTEFLTQSKDGSTPLIRHEIHERTTGPNHTFRTRCPECGDWYPGYKPVKLDAVASVINEVKAAQVYYFDRAVPSSIKLAEHYAAQGAVVCFEPNSLRDEGLFARAVATSQVVKYSQERLEDARDAIEAISCPIHIETMGSGGLRYRRNGGAWHHMDAIQATINRDSAGAGDWLSSGFLHLVGSTGAVGLQEAKQADVERGLLFGQAMAAVNCAFDGARGAMNFLSKQTFQATVQEIVRTRTHILPSTSQLSKGSMDSAAFCDKCAVPDKEKPAKARARR